MTTRRRTRAGIGAALAMILAVSACQVDGSAEPNAAAVVSLQSDVLTISAATSFSSSIAASSSSPAPTLQQITIPSSTAILTTAPLGTIEDHSTSDGPTASVQASTTPAGPTLVMADDGYPVSVMVTTVWARSLAAKGIPVGIRTMQDQETQVKALQKGQIDLAQQFNSQLLHYLDKSSGAASRSNVDATIATKLPAGLSVLKSAPGADDVLLAVSAATAEEYQLHSISDLAQHVGDVTLLLPGDSDGPDFARGLSNYYGLTFAKTKTADWGGVKTISEIKSSAAVGPMAASQWQIDENKFVTLTDPEHLFYTENFIPLVGRTITPAMAATLNAVSAKLTLGAIRGMRKKLSRSEGSAVEIADAWLASVGLK